MNDARRLAALDAGEGKVLLSWRLYSDESGPEFELERDAGEGWTPLLRTRENFFQDSAAPESRYRVRKVGETQWSEARVGPRPNVAVEFSLSHPARSYRKWAYGDTGDGGAVFVMSSMERPTLAVECYALSGKRLWEFETNLPSPGGWDKGSNHVPLIVWDVNRDGRAEVVLHCSPERRAEWDFYEHAEAGELLVALDWETGEKVWESPWPAKEARVMMTVGYLRGVDEAPAVVVQDGTYPRTGVGLCAVDGRDGAVLWSLHQDEGGGHNLDVADIDGCGVQEVIAGGVCYHGDGSVKWRCGITGHTDISKPCKLIESLAGLQIFYAVETRPSCAALVDAEGRTVFQEDFEHAHYGWIARYAPGLLPHVADKPKTGHHPVFLPDGSHWLVLSHTQARRFEPIHWSGDGLADFVRRDLTRLVKLLPDGSEEPLEGGGLPPGGRYARNNLMVDVLGDYREELATFDDERDTFFVASNPLPPLKVEATPFSDLSYAHDRSQHGSGYYIYTSPPERAS